MLDNIALRNKSIMIFLKKEKKICLLENIANVDDFLFIKKQKQKGREISFK